MYSSTLELDTELSAVNSVLSAIGQAPVTTLNFDNPEVSTIHNLLMETTRDTLNEGWVFNREQNYPLTPDADGHIAFPPNVLRLDMSDNYRFRETDVVRRNGYLYDKIGHTDVWDQKTYYFDIVWAWNYEDLPSVFQRYITHRTAMRAASQLVGNSELVQLMSQQEAILRTSCVEYECNQGDYTMFGHPDGSNYQPYSAFKALQRL